MENEEPQKIKKVSCEMRKAWFEFVRKTRTQMSRRAKEQVSHREAMKQASSGWAAEKAKIIRRNAREKKRNAKK